MKSVAESYRIGFATIRQIVPETCAAIWSELGPEQMTLPSPDQWRQNAEDFEAEWQFPNCVGAVDGKHVTIEKPANSGSVNFNYKGFFSIVLMAVVDAKCRFLYISVGSHGQESDGGVWGACDLGRMLAAQEQGGTPVLPGPKPLPGTTVRMPHVIVGDEAFPLTTHLMRPFPGKSLTNDRRRVYNYRLSRARRTAENAFGILSQRWRVYRGPIGSSVNTTKLIVQATCVLHNFLCEKDIAARRGPGSYSSLTPEDRGEVGGLVDITDLGGTHNYPRQAGRIRDEYVQYFSGPGAVPWQLASIRQ